MYFKRRLLVEITTGSPADEMLYSDNVKCSETKLMNVYRFIRRVPAE